MQVIYFVAGLKCISKGCFFTGWCVAAQMIGAMSPLVIYPHELFRIPFPAPMLAAYSRANYLSEFLADK